MCIIAAKPVGVDMPSDKIIENMWNGNSDGAGFMWAEKGNVNIRKGFMTYEDFRSALDKFCSSHDAKNTALVMHFRITTHGGTKPENCHPFPITDNISLLSKTECKTKLGVAHNGVIHITPRKDISDTMEYIATQLAPLYRGVPDFYRNKALIEMIYNATASRLAFLTGDGHIFTVGEFQEDKGIKYSNGSYKYSFRSFPYSCGYGGWSDYDDYDCAWEGTYLQRSLMWLDDGFGYIMENGDMIEDDGMYAIDANELVYRYSYTLDAMKVVPGAVAYSWTGAPIRYDANSPDTSSELVLFPDSSKPKTTTLIPRKNKKK